VVQETRLFFKESVTQLVVWVLLGFRFYCFG